MRKETVTSDLPPVKCSQCGEKIGIVKTLNGKRLFVQTQLHICKNDKGELSGGISYQTIFIDEAQHLNDEEE